LVLIGLLLIWNVIYQIMAALNPSVQVVLSHASVGLGDRQNSNGNSAGPAIGSSG